MYMTSSDSHSRILPWAEQMPPHTLSVRQLSDLLEPVVGSSKNNAGLEKKLGRLLLRWPDIRRLVTVSQAAIAKESGLNLEQAARFLAAINLGLAVAGSRAPASGVILSPEDALPYLRSLTLSRVERVWVIALDVQARCLGVREIARGTLSGCSVAIRDIFAFLLDYEAHRGIVAHNHPGGTAFPSCEDLFFTRKVVEVGTALGLAIVDHLIVTQSDFISLASMGELR